MHLTKDRKNLAVKMDLLTCIRLSEPSELLEIDGGYCLKSRPTLLISRNGFWHWKDQGDNQKSALDYLVEVKNYSPANAIVQILRLLQPEPAVNMHKNEPENLYLPRVANNTFLLKLWLHEAVIEFEIINYCLENGLIYQEKRYNNAIFVGRNRRGGAHYAAVEAIDGSGFSSEKFNEQESSGFLLPSPIEASKVKIFESPMDALAEASLTAGLDENWQECDRLAIGGLPHEAVFRYFRAHPKIKTAAVCFQNKPESTNAAQKLVSRIFLCPKIGVHYELPWGGETYLECLDYEIRNKFTTECETDE
jgi:hypothetical protein